MLIVPALVSGRPSRTSEVSVMVVPAGIESRPLPLIVPFVQVIDVEVTPIGAVPVRMPPDIVRVGTVMVDAPLRVSVPADMVSAPRLLTLLIVVVARLEMVARVTLTLPVVVCVP